MITQIKKWGSSNVIVLSPEFCKYMELKIDNWVDISDIVKVEDKK
jgi:antitoxin component of MazEF toxin-antitoxin module